MRVQASTARGSVSPEDMSKCPKRDKELQESPWHYSGIELPWENSGSFQRLGRSISANKHEPAQEVLRRLSKVLKLQMQMK